MENSIDVKQIMKTIKHEIKEKNNNKLVTSDNIISYAATKHAQSKEKITNFEIQDSGHLEYLDSISKTSDIHTETAEPFEEELTEANLSYDIQTFVKIDTSKPKIIRNLVLKIRNMLQQEVRFALNPIIDKQIKFNIHLVRALTGLKIKHQVRMDQLEIKNNRVVDLLESHREHIDDSKKEISILKIRLSYYQNLKRDPTDQEIEYWSDMLITRSIDPSVFDKSIKNLKETQKIITPNLESFQIQKLNDNILQKEIDGHIINFDIKNSAYLKAFSQNQLYEQKESMTLKKLLRRGMNVINIGAHIGYFTLLAARQVGPEGKVFAFEPFLPSVELLKKNVEANGYKNVEVVPTAVSNKRGKSNFAQKIDSTQNFLQINKTSHFIQSKVSTTIIDQFLVDRNLKIDFIIMDAEGSEKNILEGMKKTIEKNPEIQIITEYNPYTLRIVGTSGEEFLDKIEELGFSIYDINQDEKKPQEQIKEEILKIMYPNITTLHLKKNKNH